MTKKQKRSPYDDLSDSAAAAAKPPKQLRGDRAKALRKPAFPSSEKLRDGADARSNNASIYELEDGKAVPTPPVERMSIETLEQKKMLLPYLDKIEYINVQLRQRGLLQEGTATLAASVAKERSTSPSADKLLEIPTPNDKRRGKPSKLPPETDLASQNQETPSQNSTHRGVTRRHSDSQLSATDEAPIGKRPKITNDTLRLRYPRLFASIDRARLASLAPRVRPINWLLHLVEDVYDALTDTFILGRNTGSGTVSRDECSIAEPEVQGSSPSRLLKQRLVMPHLVRRHIDHVLGLAHLADQECLDLMYNMEATLNSFAPVAMFSMFVREIYDDDTLLFFIFLRFVLQQEFDLQLGAKTKLAHSSTTAKKYIPAEMVHLTPHPLLPDGSKAVYLTRDGCEQLWRRFFTHNVALNSGVSLTRPLVAPVVLAHYITTEKMRMLFDHRDEVSAEHLLVWSVDEFRNIAEDIIAQFKYKDDGESLRGLFRLRETIASDAKIGKLTALYSERERTLRNMRIDMLRLERSNTEDNKNRTQLRLLRNQITLMEQELDHIKEQVATAEILVNDVWKEVTSASPKKPIKPSAAGGEVRHNEFAKGVKELPSVVGRFAAQIARFQRKHDIEIKAASMLSKPWKEQMKELQLRMVIKIQRAFRARRRAREIKQKAKEELHERIRLHEIKKQNEFMDRKRHEALQDKDMQRHQTRMQAKQQQEEAARCAIVQKQQQLLEKMRHEQIAQRDVERKKKLQLRIFFKWRSFLVTRIRKRNANRLFLKFQFIRWRHHLVAFKHINQAARTIQHAFRRRLEVLRLRKVAQMNKKRSKIAKRYLQKIQARQVHRVFYWWVQWADNQLRLKANLEVILQRRLTYWFQQWVGYDQSSKQRRLEAVVMVQHVYRGRLARQVLQTQRKRMHAAVRIQKNFRGCLGRRYATRRRLQKAQQDARSEALLRRIQGRTLRDCFRMWRWHLLQARGIKEIEKRRRRRAKEVVFDGFADYRQRKRDKRAAFLMKQYISALLIQRQFRRHRCQVVFRVFAERYRAAVKIQRVFRGYLGRQEVRKLRWEINAAKRLQTIWRQRQARRLAEKTRAETILLAAYKGDFTATQRALKMGFWYVVDEERNGILHMAAAAGHKRIVKLCLRHQMDINYTNVHGQTPLHLLLANIPPTLTGFGGDTDTHRTIQDRVALAAYMIDHNAWHEATDELGITPLLLSAALGQTEATEMLLEKSANTDARSIAGLNAAQLCVESNHANTLRVLLDSRGFDNSSNSRDTLRLLHTCAGRGLIDCLRVLIDHLSLHELAPNQLNLRDDDGYTPLIYAINNANIDAVRCLLENGSDPNEKDYFGRSPLHFAVCVGEGGSPVIVELLIMYDVDVNVKDTDGDSALHVCCDRNSRLGCTSLLLKSGALIVANKLGNHPTHIAARQGAVDTLKLLVEYSADMNIKNYEGKTPLGMARMVGQRAVVQYIKHYFAAEPVNQTYESSGDAAVDVSPDNEDGDGFPERTQEEWGRALTLAFKMGSLAEWTHYVDAETEYSFFACPSPQSGATYCTWETPIEFDAALGELWEVTRSGGSGVAMRSREHPDTIGDDANADETGHKPRAGVGVHYMYHNKRTGELRSAVPHIDYSLLQDVVQNSKRHQQLRQKIRKVSTDTSASAMEYMRFFEEFEAESAKVRAEILAATSIQRHFRARRTKRLVRLLLFENKCAVDLQRAFRGRRARREAALKRREHACATKIQALWRGYVSRKLERELLHLDRVQHRLKRVSAVKIQRLFRGHQARRIAYRERVIQKHGPKGYFAWEQVRRRAVVRQRYKVWDEMELPLEFPGVFFYCHQVTRSCTWEKPKEWQAHDLVMFHERCQLFRWGYTQQMKLAAIRLQSLWRARQARISFRIIMKAVRLMKTSEQDYLEDPTNIVKMGNYVLFLHAIQHDYDRARPLYGRLMRTMAQRGPDVPFILFSYGIFLYVTQEDDVSLVEDMILRAKALDRQIVKYKLAFLGFFRQSLLQNPHDGESNLNYAACLQWLFNQFEESVPYYLRAIAANPHKKGSMELFQDMLNRKKLVDKARDPSLFSKTTTKNGRRVREYDEELVAKYDAYEMFRRWQVKQAEEDDLRRRKQFEAEEDAMNRLEAAKKIQARYRRRRAMRTVNRARAERQLAHSMADLADTKIIYERVRLAFDKLGEVSSPTKLNSRLHFAKKKNEAPPKIMSIPIARLDELFLAMNLSLPADEFRGTVDACRQQCGKAPNVNVMDVTSFTQSNAVVVAKLKEQISKSSK